MPHQINAPEMDGVRIGHPAFLDDPPRSEVCGANQGDDVVQVEGFKAELQRRERSLGCIAFSPMLRREQETDLGLIKLWQILQPSPADDLYFTKGQDAPVAITVGRPVVFLARNKAFDPIEGRWGRIGEIL